MGHPNRGYLPSSILDQCRDHSAAQLELVLGQVRQGRSSCSSSARHLSYGVRSVRVSRMVLVLLGCCRYFLHTHVLGLAKGGASTIAWCAKTLPLQGNPHWLHHDRVHWIDLR